jgi:glycosyltransferase involved in cell wall biosynthesis
MNKYICSFRGRRDNYQIPLALSESGLLDQFITDFYTSDFLQKITPVLKSKWQSKLKYRQEKRIPSEKVKSLFGTTLLEYSRHYLGFSRSSTYAWLDQNFSYAAISRARKTRSNLFLYTPYAWEAFLATYHHDPRKVLFAYHPHPKFESTLLAEDFTHFPFVEKSYQDQIGNALPENLQKRIRDCWKYADQILCASSFTKHTLISAGAEPSSCHIIPYGVDLPLAPFQQPNSNYFQALFVGSGVQRKGLHHLLYAWKKARLPEKSQLILVCRNLDPGIEALIKQTPNIKLIRGTDSQTLHNLYETSHLFVMPSLVEGFGHVYLESLSHGCPVLGTANTCLPDLGGENEGIFLTEVSNINELIYKLEYLAENLLNNNNIRQQARSCSEGFSWQNFRHKLLSFL